MRIDALPPDQRWVLVWVRQADGVLVPKMRRRAVEVSCVRVPG